MHFIEWSPIVYKQTIFFWIVGRRLYLFAIFLESDLDTESCMHTVLRSILPYAQESVSNFLGILVHMVINLSRLDNVYFF